jgi:MFS family permease
MHVGGTGERPGALAPLASPDFRALWAGTTGWNLARWMEIVVTGWLVFELTRSALAVALVGLCRSLALPALGLLSGVIADRTDRLRLMRLMQVVNVVTSLSVTLAVLTGRVAIWQLILASLVMGLSWAVDWPSRRSFTADLVGRAQVLQAMVLDNASMNASKIIGPIIAGWLIERAGPGAAYATITLSFLWGLAALLWVRPPARPSAAPMGSMLATLVEGLRHVLRLAPVRGVLLITIIMNMLAFPYIQLLPVVARETLAVGPMELGWLAAADGIGAAIGLPIAVRLRRARWQGWAFVLGSLLMCLCLAGFSMSRWFALSLALLVVGGIGHTAFGTMQSTIILSATPDVMRGRAMGALTLAIGSAPLGAAEIGLLAQQWGAPLAVGFNGLVGALLVALVGLATPSLFRGQHIEAVPLVAPAPAPSPARPAAPAVRD